MTNKIMLIVISKIALMTHSCPDDKDSQCYYIDDNEDN
jgi:hypothetical protein